MESKEQVLETHKENVRRNRMVKSSFWKYTTVILLLLLVASLYSGSVSLPSWGSTVEDGDVVDKAVAFINEEMLAGFAVAELVSVEEKNDYYQLDLKVETTTGEEQEFTSYVTKDGELLFPTAVDLTTFEYVVEDEEAETTESEIDYSNDPVVGNAEAEVSVVAYSDFGCEDCDDAYWATELLLEEYGDAVNLIWKNYPASEETQEVALASDCAFDQGMFEEYYDTLFQNQDALTNEDLKQYAADLGLDTEAFNVCLDSKVHLEKLLQDLTDGAELGVVVVPTYFVGEEILIAPTSFSEFEAVISPSEEVEEEAVEDTEETVEEEVAEETTEEAAEEEEVVEDTAEEEATEEEA